MNERKKVGKNGKNQNTKKEINEEERTEHIKKNN